jgi:Ni,Fe-hydrogenase maturation factor
MATHQVVLTLQGVLPPHLVLWGRESAVMEHGLDLTEPVAASLDALVDTVAGELRAWGAAV